MATDYASRIIQIMPYFLKGLWMTVVVSGISLILSTVLGFVLGILRSSRSKLLTRTIGVYVDVMRGTPFVVQIFIVFFILPSWGLQLEPLPAAILALTAMTAAFICEVVSGGIKAVPRGQWEAASASGLTRLQQLRLVVLPQSMQTILPPLVGQYVLMVKDSSVVSVIGVTELTRVGWQTVVRIPEGLMVFTLVGILYFAICYPMIRLSNYLERRLSLQTLKL